MASTTSTASTSAAAPSSPSPVSTSSASSSPSPVSSPAIPPSPSPTSSTTSSSTRSEVDEIGHPPTLILLEAIDRHPHSPAAIIREVRERGKFDYGPEDEQANHWKMWNRFYYLKNNKFKKAFNSRSFRPPARIPGTTPKSEAYYRRAAELEKQFAEAEKMRKREYQRAQELIASIQRQKEQVLSSNPSTAPTPSSVTATMMARVRARQQQKASAWRSSLAFAQHERQLTPILKFANSSAHFLGSELLLNVAEVTSILRALVEHKEIDDTPVNDLKRRLDEFNKAEEGKRKRRKDKEREAELEANTTNTSDAPDTTDTTDTTDATTDDADIDALEPILSRTHNTSLISLE